MNTEIRKKIAYDLTLEYVKQNKIMTVSMDSAIPKSINTVEKSTMKFITPWKVKIFYSGVSSNLPTICKKRLRTSGRVMCSSLMSCIISSESLSAFSLL